VLAASSSDRAGVSQLALVMSSLRATWRLPVDAPLVPLPDPAALGGLVQEICRRSAPESHDREYQRDALRAYTTKAARRCGRLLRKPRQVGDDALPDVEIAVARLGSSGRRRAVILGAVRCKSPHACPKCREVRRTADAGMLKRVVGAWRRRGGSTRLLSLTIRHRRSHALAFQVRLLRVAWRILTGSRAWQRSARTLGLAHRLHTLEMTHRVRSGWHPHIHALLLTTAVRRRDVVEAVRTIRAEWHAALRRALTELHVDPAQWVEYLPSDRHGASLVDAAGSGDYLLADAPDSGTVRGSRCVTAIMNSAAAGNAVDCALWQEYTHAMLGAHLVHGLGDAMKALGVSRATDSVDVTPRDLARNHVTIARLSEPHYRLLERRPGAVQRILSIAETDGLRAIAIALADEVYGERTTDPRVPSAQVHRLIRRCNPAGGCAHPSTWLPAGERGGRPLRHLRRIRQIVVNTHHARARRRPVGGESGARPVDSPVAWARDRRRTPWRRPGLATRILFGDGPRQQRLARGQPSSAPDEGPRPPTRPRRSSSSRTSRVVSDRTR